MVIYSVNDAAVMKAWERDQNVPEDSMFHLWADTSGKFTEAVGMQMTHPGPVTVLGGVRCKRFSLYVDDCIVKVVNVAEAEDDPAGDDAPEASMPEKILSDIAALAKDEL